MATVRFEYDMNYTGGEYSNVGYFAYVPVEACKEWGYERAFEFHTGHDCCHIIHYSPDELYDEEGERLEEDLTEPFLAATYHLMNGREVDIFVNPDGTHEASDAYLVKSVKFDKFPTWEEVTEAWKE